MSIRVLALVALEEAPDEAISSALGIHHFQLLRVPDNNPNLVVFTWLLGDVVSYDVILVTTQVVYFSPEDECALRHLSAVVAKPSVLNGLVQE